MSNEKVKKLVRVKVDTPKGVRYLTFGPVESIPTDQLICSKSCPYGSICDKIFDPRNPDKFPEYTFTDFCAELGMGVVDDGNDSSDTSNQDESLMSMVPIKGTIESAFGDDYPDIFQQIIGNNSMIRVKDFIEKVCSKWCEHYKDDHSECRSSNKFCLLQNIFYNNKPEENNNNDKG